MFDFLRFTKDLMSSYNRYTRNMMRAATLRTNTHKFIRSSVEFINSRVTHQFCKSISKVYPVIIV